MRFKIQNCHSTLPGIKNRLKATVISRIKNSGFSPFSINLTGTFDMMMTAARKTVASRYPQKEFATKSDTRNMMVPTNFTRVQPVENGIRRVILSDGYISYHLSNLSSACNILAFASSTVVAEVSTCSPRSPKACMM